MTKSISWRDAETHLKRNDEILAKIIGQIGECTLTAEKNNFVALIESIVSQQLSIKAANTIWGRAKNVLQNDLTPKRVLATSEEELRAAGLSRQKASYVKNIAQAWTDGLIPENRLPEMTDAEVARVLTQIKGVGPWTADMFLIFTLGRADVLPAGDLSFKNVVKKLYDLNDFPDKEKLAEITAPWRPWRSIGAWYCWKVLDMGMLKF